MAAGSVALVTDSGERFVATFYRFWEDPVCGKCDWAWISLFDLAGELSASSPLEHGLARDMELGTNRVS